LQLFRGAIIVETIDFPMLLAKLSSLPAALKNSKIEHQKIDYVYVEVALFLCSSQDSS